MFISVLLAMVFAVVFLTTFPSFNTLFRSIPSPVGAVPIVNVQIVLMPYIFCAIAFWVLILIVKNKIQS